MRCGRVIRGWQPCCTAGLIWWTAQEAPTRMAQQPMMGSPVARWYSLARAAPDNGPSRLAIVERGDLLGSSRE